MITIIYQFKHNVMWHCRKKKFRFLNKCKFGYTCFWLVTIDMHIMNHSTVSLNHIFELFDTLIKPI